MALALPAFFSVAGNIRDTIAASFVIGYFTILPILLFLPGIRQGLDERERNLNRGAERIWNRILDLTAETKEAVMTKFQTGGYGPAFVEPIQNLFGANQRSTGQRGLLMWFRTGSDVVVPNAFRMLDVPTTA